MNVLVINCGSSSLKFQLIDADTNELLSNKTVTVSATDKKSSPVQFVEIVRCFPGPERYAS